MEKNTSKVNKLNGLGRSQAKLSHCGVVFVQLKKCRDKKLFNFDLSITLFWVLPKNIDNDWGDLTLLFFHFLLILTQIVGQQSPPSTVFVGSLMVGFLHLSVKLQLKP